MESSDEDKDLALPEMDTNTLQAKLYAAGLSTELIKNEFSNSLNSESLNSKMPQLEKALDTVIQSEAQDALKEDIIPASVQNTLSTTLFRNDFKDITEIGMGCFGKVYQATHKLDGKNYAIKTIVIKPNSDMDKLLREVRALADLNHINIIRYYNAWCEDDSRVSTSTGTEKIKKQSWFAKGRSQLQLLALDHKKPIRMLCIQTELCDSTLQDLLKDRNEKLETISTDYDMENLSPAIEHIFIGVVSGVAYIHSKGLMHRDLKPPNVFLCGPDHQVKIGDFGFVKGICGSDSVLSSPTIEGVPTTNNSGIGTRLYAAPERLEGKTCDTKCDMFSLGVMLLEMCNLTKHPGTIPAMAELLENNCWPEDFVKFWSRNKVQLIVDLINDLMKPEPDRRPTAKDVLRVFRNPPFTTAVVPVDLYK